MIRVAVVAIVATLASTARADSWRVSADVDLNTVAELGGSLWIAVKPPATPQWRFGGGGFFTGVPRVFVDLDERNRDEGWVVLPRGALAFVEWFPRGDARGFYIGAYAGYVRFRYTRDDMLGDAAVGHVTFEPHVGYQWFPFANGAYIQPWIGFAAVLRTDGSATVGDQAYAELPVVPLYGVNLGYELR
jgi:hypothetical protein